MAIHDNQLDDAITLALEMQTAVTTRQKASAWEALRVRAAQQVMMVPYAIAPSPPVPRRTRLYQHMTRFMQDFAHLLTDDRVYHRAAAKRHATGITHTIGNAIVMHYYPLQPMLRFAI